MDYITRPEFQEFRQEMLDRFQRIENIIERNWRTYNEELYAVVKDTDYAKEWLPRIQRRLDQLENRVDHLE